MLPPIAQTQLKWFTRYVRFYLRRNFHGLHLLRLAELEQLEGRPLLLCVTHPSWWDPLLALYLSQRLWPKRLHYGPMAAAGIEKYKFFQRLGFFGIDPKTRTGAERFLRYGTAVLRQPNGAFWVTPQGSFADVRQHPVQLSHGIGHLTRRSDNLVMIPVALEYAFWNERFPEAFAAIGEPVEVQDGRARSVNEWMQLYSVALERTQGALSSRVVERDPSAFEPLLEGSAGVGGIYDVWRGLAARALGKRFSAEHGRI